MANRFKKICDDVLPPFMRLPVELQSEIFLRLPVISLSTCKHVCNSFRTLIQNPDFRNNHINTSHSLILQFNHYRNSSEIDHTSHVLVSIDKATKDVISYTSLNPEIPDVRMLFLIGSCNGLVCFAVRTDENNKYRDDFLLLWNPVTKQSKRIPLPDIDGYDHQQTMEFYFVPGTNDYNILSIGFIRDMPDYIHVAVYRVSTNSCEIVDLIRLGHEYHEYYNNNREWECSTSVFLNESFHWIFLSKGSSEIVSFNIKDEKLGWIRCIDHDECIPGGIYDLGIIDESLALLCWSSDRKDIKIEVMNDYEVQDSWFLKYTLGPNHVGLQGCWKNCVMTSDGHSLYFYDTHNAKMTEKLISLPENSSLSGYSNFLLPWSV